MCTYQGLRNVSFFGKFCVRTKWMNPKSKLTTVTFKLILVLFLQPLKTSENIGFLMFSEGIEMCH